MQQTRLRPARVFFVIILIIIHLQKLALVCIFIKVCALIILAISSGASAQLLKYTPTNIPFTIIFMINSSFHETSDNYYVLYNNLLQSLYKRKLCKLLIL